MTSLEQKAEQVDKVGAANVDVIALPELCRGQSDVAPEESGPVVWGIGKLCGR